MIVPNYSLICFEMDASCDNSKDSGIASGHIGLAVVSSTRASELAFMSLAEGEKTNG